VQINFPGNKWLFPGKSLSLDLTSSQQTKEMLGIQVNKDILTYLKAAHKTFNTLEMSMKSKIIHSKPGIKTPLF
jgi:hypothetical protein